MLGKDAIYGWVTVLLIKIDIFNQSRLNGYYSETKKQIKKIPR